MEYEAFISYSHDDEKSASWIHRTLEGFRVPERLVAELGLASNRFLPVFRDKDELSSSADLSDTLLAALRTSRCLIVVCSPSSAKSRWVNEEVAAFQAQGRGDRVFCVIVAGDPGDPSSCFPENLRGTEPLAMDLRRGHDGRRNVRLRLAASILGVGFDRLRQRDAQRRRRRRVNQTVSFALAAMVIAGLTYRYAITPPCQDSAARLADVWNPQAQAAIRKAFVATGMPYARDAYERVQQRLDDYRDAWIAMHGEACEATLVREEQSPELMDLRMACLNERRTEFASLSRALLRADGGLVERAVDASGELRGLQRCENREQLLAAYPLPEDAGQRQAIEALRDDLAAARAQLATGALAEVREVVEEYSVRAQQHEYPSLEAEALLLRSAVEQQSGRSETAKEALYAAAA
ncbi:MAG: toll/interleukin-1 receptor domain-containing protein, partial [Gammaproteobacteria bacterium]|nr:toll/interleukin-1 receptor domain-containing protein [Gammaproteobacteria bacterium]